MRIAAVVVIAGCGRTPIAPDGEIGWVGGVWIGNLTYEDRSVAAVLWLEQDGEAIAGAGVQLSAVPPPGRPVSAPADLATISGAACRASRAR